MLQKDIADNKAIGTNGAAAILDVSGKDTSVRVLTHCNTGSLATAGYGTALGVVRKLHELKKLGELNQFFNSVRCLESSVLLKYRIKSLKIDRVGAHLVWQYKNGD